MITETNLFYLNISNSFVINDVLFQFNLNALALIIRSSGEIG